MSADRLRIVGPDGGQPMWTTTALLPEWRERGWVPEDERPAPRSDASTAPSSDLLAAVAAARDPAAVAEPVQELRAAVASAREALPSRPDSPPAPRTHAHDLPAAVRAARES